MFLSRIYTLLDAKQLFYFSLAWLDHVSFACQERTNVNLTSPLNGKQNLAKNYMKSLS